MPRSRKRYKVQMDQEPKEKIINPSCPRCTLLCTEKEPNGQSIFIQTMALNFDLTSV